MAGDAVGAAIHFIPVGTVLAILQLYTASVKGSFGFQFNKQSFGQFLPVCDNLFSLRNRKPIKQ